MRTTLTAAFLLTLAGPAAASPPSLPALPSSAALDMARAAVAACAARGYAVSAAIVDADGILRTLITADRVKPIDIESAHRKAITAAALNASTLDIAAKVASAPALDHALTSLDPSLLFLGGGLPVSAGGNLLGGIGVGGAPGGDRDQACAQSGLDAARAALMP